VFSHDDPAAYRGVRWILVATPDDQIWSASRQLADLGVVGRQQVVLHLSGALDQGALKPLRLTGAALGSMHPLQSVAVAAAAATRLPGSFAGLEGDARAIRAGRRLATALGLIPVVLPPGSKPAYHAAGTFVSTFLVVLFQLAISLVERAGIPAKQARVMFLPLMEGAVDNLRLLPPRHAMTGAVRRGDVATVKAHLAALSKADRELYQVLARRAVALARTLPLAPPHLAEMERVLGGR
jgi:predicted short-subunit dehydrogenase-like oxidoreductase (DUF2520 family)